MKRCYGILLVGILLLVLPIKSFANSKLSNYSDKEICRFASDKTRWKTKSFYQQFVTEAKNRGITISFCNSNEELLEVFKAKERKKIHEQRAQAKQMIIDNCVISKATEIAPLEEVRRICRNIAENPTFLQKLRWGDYRDILE